MQQLETRGAVTREKGNPAIGAYIQRLRERQGLTKTGVASQVGTDLSGLDRIETAESNARYTLLLAVVRAVNGNPEDLFRLSERDDMSREEGVRMADAWLDKPRAQRTAEELIAEYGPEILEILDDLSPEPKSLGEWIGYGRALRRRPTG